MLFRYIRAFISRPEILCGEALISRKEERVSVFQDRLCMCVCLSPSLLPSLPFLLLLSLLVLIRGVT